MIKNLFQHLRENISLVIVLCIVLVFSIFRIYAYGDIRLSIAGNDTDSYISSSRVPLFSSEMLIGRRLLTTNLLYKIFEPKDGYEILVNGSVETTRRIVQPDFIGIVILQLAFSIIGWGYLAIVVAGNLNNILMKILATVLILLFAFTPQTADWDSILMSESLTFSLFALELALLIKITSLLYKNNNSNITGWMIAWALVHFIWTFIRDTNLFVSFVTGLLISLLYVSKEYRKNKHLHFALIFLILVFMIGIITASQSTRSQVQIRNIYADDIFPSPLRVEIFKEMGMPSPDSNEYRAWFEENSSKTLIMFMLKHPGYPILKIINDFPIAFNEIKQTYFKAPELRVRTALMAVGDAFHPENTTPFLVSLILLIGIIQMSIKNNGDIRAWAWLAVWLFLSSTIMLIPTILGDTWAINRHALLSTTIYRLSMWLFAIIIIDIALEKNPQPTQITS